VWWFWGWSALDVLDCVLDIGSVSWHSALGGVCVLWCVRLCVTCCVGAMPYLSCATASWWWLGLLPAAIRTAATVDVDAFAHMRICV
jgi:hypothetical protein